jgi:hypothetical protein
VILPTNPDFLGTPCPKTAANQGVEMKTLLSTILSGRWQAPFLPVESPNIHSPVPSPYF